MSELSLTEPIESSAGIDPVKYEQMMHELRAEQSMLLALVAGVLASAVAAAIWAGITYVTKYQIGFMAIGVGFLVGYAVRYFGNGLTAAYGVIGAAFSVFGCLLGNILVSAIGASLDAGMPVLAVVSTFVTSPIVIVEILKETFSPIDLLFYAIAIYEGYRLSIRQVTDEEMSSVMKTATPPPPPPPVPVETPGNAV